MNIDKFWDSIELVRKVTSRYKDIDTTDIETELFEELLGHEGIKVYKTSQPIVLINNSPVAIPTRNLGNRETFETFLTDLRNSFGVVLFGSKSFVRLSEDTAGPVTMLSARIHPIMFKEDIVTVTDSSVKPTVTINESAAAHVAAILEGAE